MNYEEYNNKLYDSLLKEKKRVILNPNRIESRSIFGIADSTDKTYQMLLRRLELKMLEWSEDVTKELCKFHSTNCTLNPNKYGNHGDIIIYKNEIAYSIEFKTGAFPTISPLHTFSDYAKDPTILVLLIDDSESSQNIIELWQNRINSITKKNIKVINYLDFIRFFFGPEEAESSEQNLKIIKKKAKEIIGQRITDICTPEQRISFKKELASTLIDFDYDSLIEKYNLIDKDGLYANDLSAIKNNFIELKRYSILLGEKEFADSFFTSEWLFQKYSEQDGLDNTYMVTSYIKSIEQLLWNIVYVIGQGRRIGRNRIKINDDDSIRTTLEDFCYFVRDNNNRNLCDKSFEYSHRYSLMDVIFKRIVDYKNNCRNGYFHKENLDSRDVKTIREKTFLLYFLLLGVFNLDDVIVSTLKQA